MKQSSRAIQKFQTQQTLEDIVNEKIISSTLTILATIHLCELLLIELQSFGEAEVFKEIKTLVQNLYTLGQSQQSFSLVVDVLILQAKFALIEGKIKKSMGILDQARITAEEKNLGLLIDKLKREKQHFDDEFDKWENLIKHDDAFQERIKQAHLEEYLREILKKVQISK
ncbi:MAG: hypothetical protein ACXAC7_21480 [Candidatus Hodarchaeales archaeon]